MNCKICFDNYSDYKKPYSIFPCNHTFCIRCLNNLTDLRCPKCRTIIRDKKPNYELIEILEFSSIKSENLSIEKTNDAVSTSVFKQNKYVKNIDGNTGNAKSLIELIDNTIASSSGENEIIIWDLETSQCVRSLKGHTNHVYSLALISHNESKFIERLVSGGGDSTIKIWNPFKGNCIRTLVGHTGTVFSLLVSNYKIISGSEDKSIKIWGSRRGECLYTLHGHEGSVLALTNYAYNLVSGGTDKTIKIWEYNTFRFEKYQCILTLTGHTDSVLSLNILSNNNIVSGSCDKTVKIWDPNTGQCIKTLDECSTSICSILVLDEWEDLIVTPGQMNTIKIWNPNTGECMHDLKGHKKDVVSLGLMKNDRIVSSSEDNTIKIWEL